VEEVLSSCATNLIALAVSPARASNLYVLAIPHHPYLVMGPGAQFLTILSATFAPVWRPFYVALIGLLLVQLAVKLVALARGHHRWENSLKLLTNLLGLVPAGILAFAKVYFVPTSVTVNFHALAEINYWTNVGLRITLMILVLNLLVESWQYFRRMVPAERLAF
jgi:hypothetical protein